MVVAAHAAVMTSIFVSQELFSDAVGRIEAAGLGLEYRDAAEPASPEDLRAALQGHDGLVCLLTDSVDRALLDANPQLRVVANCAAGFDNIDVAAATERGVLVTNTPGVLTTATADLTMALLLATARRVPEADRFLREGHYRHWRLRQEQTGVDVSGRTLGIVGLGQIGRAVARRARHGFQMDVCYTNPQPLAHDEEVELGVRHVEFSGLLERSDFISIHAPATDETIGMFGPDEFARMQPHAVLINTARGPIVQEAALADAVERGEIAGAGLDVFEREPTVHPRLLELTERVVLLPHIGSATDTTRRRMADTAITNALAALTGQRPPNLVNAGALAEA